MNLGDFFMSMNSKYHDLSRASRDWIKPLRIPLHISVSTLKSITIPSDKTNWNARSFAFYLRFRIRIGCYHIKHTEWLYMHLCSNRLKHQAFKISSWKIICNLDICTCICTSNLNLSITSLFAKLTPKMKFSYFFKYFF
jgi:hypothetical protein